MKKMWNDDKDGKTEEYLRKLCFQCSVFHYDSYMESFPGKGIHPEAVLSCGTGPYGSCKANFSASYLPVAVVQHLFAHSSGETAEV
jgi:hypothetical protein